jgi:hypothetical protein
LYSLQLYRTSFEDESRNGDGKDEGRRLLGQASIKCSDETHLEMGEEIKFQEGPKETSGNETKQKWLL